MPTTILATRHWDCSSQSVIYSYLTELGDMVRWRSVALLPRRLNTVSLRVLDKRVNGKFFRSSRNTFGPGLRLRVLHCDLHQSQISLLA